MLSVNATMERLKRGANRSHSFHPQDETEQHAGGEKTGTEIDDISSLLLFHNCAMYRAVRLVPYCTYRTWPLSPTAI